MADMLTQRPPFRFGSGLFSDWSAICPFVWHPPSVENKNKMLQELLKSYLQLLVFAACWEHLPNKGNMANIRGANLPNHHKQSNCQTAQLRLQTALRQDLFTFPCSRPPTQNLQPHISRLQAKSNGRTRLLARQRTDGSNIPSWRACTF